eukprot:g2757.t1
MSSNSVVAAAALAGAVVGAVSAMTIMSKKERRGEEEEGIADPTAFIFPTVVGPNLLQELPITLARPFLVVTMKDLWRIEAIRGPFASLPAEECIVHFVETLEEDDLANFVQKYKTSGVKAVLGLGGGQAVDVAKYFSWRSNIPLVQCPTALTVDACWGHRAAVRHSGVVKYVGYAVPQTIYCDTKLIRSAPKALNLSGVGDVFCYYTAHADWKLAEKMGKEGDAKYDERIVKQARAVLDKLLSKKNMDEIKALTDNGIRALVTALAYGGAAYCSHGWLARPVEGFDHIFFYALEHHTKKHFIHGYPVLLGVFFGARMHEDLEPSISSRYVLRVCRDLGIDIRPESMGITWQDVFQTLENLQNWVETTAQMWTIANISADIVTKEWLEECRAVVEATFA